MSITALIFILLLPFGVGFVLNHLDTGRKKKRFG